MLGPEGENTLEVRSPTYCLTCCFFVGAIDCAACARAGVRRRSARLRGAPACPVSAGTVAEGLRVSIGDPIKVMCDAGRSCRSAIRRSSAVDGADAGGVVAAGEAFPL